MDTSPSGAADYLSINSFLNAYVREFDDWRCCASPLQWQADGFPAQALVIPLGHQTLWVGIRYWSVCGRHRFALPVRCEDSERGSVRQCGFLSMGRLLIENAAIQTNGTIGAMARFLERVIESHRNLEMLLALRDGEIEGLFRASLSFQEAEQALLVGHSVHPAPKVRQPMTLTEAVQYGPEGGSGFALGWMLVRKERIHYHSADGKTLEQRVQSLVDTDSNLAQALANVPAGYVLIPVHPWQLQRLQQLGSLQQGFQQQDIIILPPQGQRWFATSSMRTLYAPTSPYMLKFSLSVRLTNSVRHLQAAEAERGCLIAKVFATETGQQFSKRFKEFSVMQEPAYLCLLDDNGMKVLESMMVFRDNPFCENAQPEPGATEFNVLATLTQDHPAADLSRLSRMVLMLSKQKGLPQAKAASHWFAAFLNVAVRPLLLAQADYGVLFGAHQQNIVLGLQQGLPVKCYFRDCQGTGFSDTGMRLFKLDQGAIGESANNQIENAMANKLFAYYLIINSTFGVISAMGADGIVEEEQLIGQLQAFLQQHLVSQRKDPSFIRMVLESDCLWQKGNFICSLADMNENTLADPVSIYRPVANPACVRPSTAQAQNAMTC